MNKRIRVWSILGFAVLLGFFSSTGEAEETRKVTYLGVGTGAIDAALREQLDLDEGAGLIVEHVDGEGPSADLLKKHDIIKELDRQILFNHNQLAALVKTYEPGETVTVKVLRKGKDTNVKVKLGEKEESAADRSRSRGRDAFQITVPTIIEPFRQHKFRGARYKLSKDQLDKVLENLEKEVGNLKDTLLDQENINGLMERIRKQLEAIQSRAENERKRLGMIRSTLQKDGTTIMEAVNNQIMTVTDDDGVYTLMVDDGNKHFSAVEKDGEVLFDGPVNTDAEKEKLSGEMREQLENLEGAGATTVIRRHPGSEYSDQTVSIGGIVK
ncbi:PDZ domain-containing protein [Candidatus Hydrogenedentota bacterium]